MRDGDDESASAISDVSRAAESAQSLAELAGAASEGHGEDAAAHGAEALGHGAEVAEHAAEHAGGEEAAEVFEGVEAGAEVVHGVIEVIEAAEEGDAGAVAGAAGGALGAGMGAIAGAVDDEGAAGVLGGIAAAAGSIGPVIGAVEALVHMVEEAIGGEEEGVVEYHFTCEADPDAEWVVGRVLVREAMGRPYSSRIELWNLDLNANPEELLGQNATLVIGRTHGVRRYMHGIVRRVEQGGSTSRAVAATVEVVPALEALRLTRDSRIWQDLTVVEVLDAVLGSGLSTYGRELMIITQKEYPIREYFTQYQETDLDFCHRLLEEFGLSYHFLHEEEGPERLIIVDSVADYPRVPMREGLEAGEIRFDASGSEADAAEVISELVREKQLTSTSTVVREFDWTQLASNQMQTKETRREDELNRDREIFEHERALVMSEYSADNAAFAAWDTGDRCLLVNQTHGAPGTLCRGASVVTGMAAGYVFHLTGHPRYELDGDYLALEVEHTGVSAEARALMGEGEGSETRYENRIRVIPKKLPHRPGRLTPKPRIAGVQTAIVVGPGPRGTIHADRHGRVRVQMHWDRYGTSDERSSCFVRVMQQWAGHGYGALFTPRVGNEVVVQFIDGDPDRPLIVGGVYNGENRTPFDPETQPNIEGWRSNSVGENGETDLENRNEFWFDDTEGSELVRLHAQKDLRETVEHDHDTHVDRNQSNTVDVDQSETIGQDQTLHVKRDRTKTVDGNEDVFVIGTRHTEIGVDSADLIEGNHEETVNGWRKVCVDGKESETFNAGREATVAEFDNTRVHANKNTTVDSQYNITAGEHFKVVQNGETLYLGDAVFIESSNHTQLKAPGVGLDMQDGVAVLRAQQEIRFEVGSSKIKLTPAGVQIVANLVTINGGESTASFDSSGVAIEGTTTARLSAGAMITISGGVVMIN